ncbi:MAG: 3-hydroxyacyl-CoA dehydrogenase NAD-binding domain-containing protein [Planctomycetota bacterium]
MKSERLMGVVGTGSMGAGIAEAAATAGFVVEALDTTAEAVGQAYALIARRLDGRVSAGKLTAAARAEILSRLRVAECQDCLKDAECIIEAVSEEIDLKRRTLAGLDAVASPRTLLATCTSGLSIGELGEGLSQAGRFLGMRFYSPAAIVEVVELVQGPATSDQALVDARAVCAKLGKTAVKVEDSPGFIGDRVETPYYLAALGLLDTGEADIRSIDAAVREVGGFKLGPFEALDAAGVDNSLHAVQTLHAGFGGAGRFRPNAIQEKLVAGGHVGIRTGRGFYHYQNGESTPAYECPLKDVSGWAPSPALAEFAEALEAPADRAAWIFGRVFAAVLNEAALVADTIALPRDVNLTMEHGFHYPEGPLALADRIGLDVVQRLLAECHQETGGDECYAPNPMLDRLVAEGHLGEKTARGFLYHAL